MALHENFKEYTEAEIRQIKKDVCLKHKCPYVTNIANNNKGKKGNDYYTNKCCNYLLYAGKRRDCMPDECTHYLDKGVKRKRFTEDIGRVW